MGTPDFAETCLAALYDSGEDITAVFTQPDKPNNRGRKLAMSPVKQLALEHGTPVFQPQTLRSEEMVRLIAELDPELICAVAYGKLLPPDILSIPRFGCVNIHGSILPKYRGAAPIQWTVLNGAKEAGVTAMYMAEGMDTGDIISIRSTPVGDYETAGELFDRLAVLGADLLVETVSSIAAGTADRIPQDESKASYAPPLTTAISPINWGKTPREIINHIRGLVPWPVATACISGTEFKVFSAVEGNGKGTPGTVISAGNNGLEIACKDGSVLITELQAAGSKRMRTADYLRGHPIKA